MNTETRNLLLKTSWISQSNDPNNYFELTIDNAQGKIDKNNESYTWYNVNLQQIMGDAYYNRYTKFSIRLTDVKNTFLPTTYNTNTSEVNSDIYNNTMMEYYLSGLLFDPSINRVIMQTIVDPMIPIDASGSGFVSATPTHMTNQTPIYYFNKPATSVNINIDRIVLNTQNYRVVNSVNDVIGPSMFMFEIVGIN